MQFEELRRNWNRFGETDPLWAVLTDPSKRHGKWDPEEFFKTGREEIGRVLARVRGLGVTVGTGTALDFGCGVGRLTQALADHFDRAVGVDVAASMVEHARQFNRHGERVRYVLNESQDLAQLPTGGFDFVYSRIALQHMRGEYAAGYMGEFMRLLKPGGVAVFDMPAGRKVQDGGGNASRGAREAVRAALNGAWKGVTGNPLFPTMEVHTLPRARVEAVVAAGGARVVDVTDDLSAGQEWPGHVYVAVKEAAHEPMAVGDAAHDGVQLG